MAKFVCTVCGWSTEADSQPAECPVCKATTFTKIDADSPKTYACEHKVGDGKVNDDFWTKMNKKWHDEKTGLINQLQRINRADEEFYNMCEMLLKFCKNAHDMYINGTTEEKRFITSTVISNITYYDKKLDIELFPVFYILSDLIKEEDKKFNTIEPTESIDLCQR